MPEKNVSAEKCASMKEIIKASLIFLDENKNISIDKAFIEGCKFLANELKHKPWDPDDKHCMCLTCKKLHGMGL